MQTDLPPVNDNPAPQDVQFLEERINDYNFTRTDITDGRLLSIFLRDEGGAILAGVYGWTWGGCCEVRFLWVREDQRGNDYGQRLLAAAEGEAAARGCSQIVLSTHSFQAPDFYRKFGYKVAGVYDDYPKGHQQIFMRKSLPKKKVKN